MKRLKYAFVHAAHFLICVLPNNQQPVTHALKTKNSSVQLRQQTLHQRDKCQQQQSYLIQWKRTAYQTIDHTGNWPIKHHQLWTNEILRKNSLQERLTFICLSHLFSFSLSIMVTPVISTGMHLTVRLSFTIMYNSRYKRIRLMRV